MVELAEAGAAGFTDDGRPVASAGAPAPRAPVQRRRRAADRAPLRGADALARRADARGRRRRPSSASAAIPSVAESLMVARDLALAAYEERPLHLLHLSARESVEELRRAQAAGRRRDRRGDAAPPAATDEAVRSLDSNLKMNPPLRARRPRRRSSTRSATGRSPRSRPITRRTRGTRRRCRSRRRRSASPASRPRSRVLYTRLVEPGVAAASRRCSSA